MESITQNMVDCWRANYCLDTRSPADAARYWGDTCAGMAPAGAVAALGLLLQERDALRSVARKVRRWDRPLWGVVFTGSMADDAPMLIGRLWAADLGGNPYPGEPTRALLFCTRNQARAWCAETVTKWRGGQRDDCVSRWRVRAVRVRETVQVEAPNV